MYLCVLSLDLLLNQALQQATTGQHGRHYGPVACTIPAHSKQDCWNISLFKVFIWQREKQSISSTRMNLTGMKNTAISFKVTCLSTPTSATSRSPTWEANTITILHAHLFWYELIANVEVNLWAQLLFNLHCLFFQHLQKLLKLPLQRNQNSLPQLLNSAVNPEVHWTSEEKKKAQWWCSAGLSYFVGLCQPSLSLVWSFPLKFCCVYMVVSFFLMKQLIGCAVNSIIPVQGQKKAKKDLSFWHPIVNFPTIVWKLVFLRAAVTTTIFWTLENCLKGEQIYDSIVLNCCCCFFVSESATL